MTNMEKLPGLLAQWGQPGYRMRQILHALFRQRITRFEAMTSLPQSLRNDLREALGKDLLSLVPREERRSSQADKVLFDLPGGGRIEAVRLHYKAGWESYCVSSQCGCRFGCKFCATGTMGFSRDLTAWEIAEELLYFHVRGHPLQSVSFMGMGEPLANPHLPEALGLLTDPALFGLSQRRITISTVGVVPGMEMLTKDWPQVNLAYSLHAPSSSLRRQLMPVERRWPMEQCLDTLDRHIRKTNRRVFLAYTLLRDVNDRPSHAAELARVLLRRPRELPLYHVDLIPYNETEHARGRFAAPGRERARDFQDILRKEGISCTVRTQFGADISAACGQLCAKEEK